MAAPPSLRISGRAVAGRRRLRPTVHQSSADWSTALPDLHADGERQAVRRRPAEGEWLDGTHLRQRHGQWHRFTGRTTDGHHCWIGRSFLELWGTLLPRLTTSLLSCSVPTWIVCLVGLGSRSGLLDVRVGTHVEHVDATGTINSHLTFRKPTESLVRTGRGRYTDGVLVCGDYHKLG